MAKILLTGGAGFIGSHIADGFIAQGDSVTVIDDLSSGSLDNLDKNASFHRLDIRSREAREAARDLAPDVLVHCAAQISVRVSMEDPTLDTEINLVGLVNLLQAFAGRPLPHFVMISTGGAIYGEQEYFPADEDHPIAPRSVYGLAKRASELYLDLWSREWGLKYCSLRLANVYGPRQNPHGEAGVLAIFLKKALAGEVPVINGTGEQTRDFVFVKDVARAVLAASNKRAQGIYNIGTGRETSVNRLFELVQKSMNFQRSAEHIPAKAGEQMRSCISPERAAKALDWKPSVSFEEGLAITADWFSRQAGKI